MEIIRRLFSFWSHHTIAGTLCRLEAQAKAAILCLCGAFPAPLLWWSGPLSLPPRTTLLLIYRIQSHTHPKRRKFCLKHAGRKSVKEELPERRKGPKRAIECRLKVPTHVWEQDAGSSSLPTRTMWSVLIGSEYPTKDTPHFLLSKLGQRRFHRTAADPGCTGALPCAG